eukprot:3916578-Amphidinium_carterae.1
MGSGVAWAASAYLLHGSLALRLHICERRRANMWQWTDKSILQSGSRPKVGVHVGGSAGGHASLP